MTAISAPKEPIKSALQDNEVRKLFSRFFELLTRRARTLVPNAFDRDVFLFIADRTLPFGKLSKDIPDRWFLDGVTGKGNSRGHRAGLSMGRSQLYESRKELRDRGLIRDQKVGRCKRYAVALEPVWAILSTEERELFAPLLNLSDPDWQAEKVHSVDVQQVHSVDPHTEKRCPFRTRAEEKKSSAPIVAPDADRVASPSSTEEEGAHAPVEAHRAVAPAIQVETPAPAKSVLPASGTYRARAVPRELWARTLFDRFDAATRQFWPDTGAPQAPSGKLRGQWEHFAKSWRRTDIAVGDWIEWTVENWRAVYATVFRHVENRQRPELEKQATTPWAPKSGWRTPMAFPEYPDFGFLLVYHRAFLSEYDRRDTQRFRLNSDFKSREIRRLMYHGYNHADAEAEVTEAEARIKRREDLDARDRELNERVRRVEAKERDVDNRIALGWAARARWEARSVKPVSPAGYPKPSFSNGAGAIKRLSPRPVWRDEIEPLPPLAEWKDELEEVNSQASGLTTTRAVAA